MPQLNSKHHALIQSLLSRGPLQEKDFHSLFAGVSGVNPATHKHVFNDYLLNINKELAYVQLELRGCRDQYDGKVYYGVINNVGDEQSKLGTKYSVPQIALYKAVVEAIIQDVSSQGSITNIDALNLRLDNQVQTGQDPENSESRVPPAFKSFSISQKEKTLNELIKDRWLSNISDGKIGLGIRSFLDLRSWFRSNDIPPCEACNEAGVKASACPNEGCTVRMHDYCLKKKFSQKKVARTCPRCNTLWSQVEGGEEEEEEEEEADVPEQSQVPSNDRQQKRIRRVKVEVVEAAQAEERRSKKVRKCKTENVDTEEGEPSHKTRSSGRLSVHVSLS